MICNKCNYQNEDTAKFCGSCGAKLINNIFSPPKKIRFLALKIIALILLICAFAYSSSVSTASFLANDKDNLYNHVCETTWNGGRIAYDLDLRIGFLYVSAYQVNSKEVAVAMVSTQLNTIFSMHLSVTVCSFAGLLCLSILGFRKK